VRETSTTPLEENFLTMDGHNMTFFEYIFYSICVHVVKTLINRGFLGVIDGTISKTG
jgi:hypothetical protein